MKPALGSRRLDLLANEVAPAGRLMAARGVFGAPRHGDENVRGPENHVRQDRTSAMMKILGPDNGELLQIASLETEGGKLVMKGKVLARCR